MFAPPEGAWKCVQGEVRHLLKESKNPRFVTSIELVGFEYPEMPRILGMCAPVTAQRRR